MFEIAQWDSARSINWEAVLGSPRLSIRRLLGGHGKISNFGTSAFSRRLGVRKTKKGASSHTWTKSLLRENQLKLQEFAMAPRVGRL